MLARAFDSRRSSVPSSLPGTLIDIRVVVVTGTAGSRRKAGPASHGEACGCHEIAAAKGGFSRTAPEITILS